MAEVTAEEIGKLRELVAECQPVEGVMPNGDVGTLTEVTLSALDALEAANRIKVENAEAAEWWKRRAKAAEDALEAADFGGRYGALLPRLRAAEASRDQAMEDRAVLASLPSRSVVAERDRLAEALRDVLPSLRSTDPRAKIIRAALAGVPGGSPEEHNPGGTAVAVPGSETAKTRGERLRGGSGASNVGRDPAAPLHTARDGKTGGAER